MIIVDIEMPQTCLDCPMCSEIDIFGDRNCIADYPECRQVNIIAPRPEWCRIKGEYCVGKVENDDR